MPTHYQVLGLPSSFHSSARIPAQTIRNAYRRALLLHHPDKSSRFPVTNANLQPNRGDGATFSIDQITEAFDTLSNPTSRAQYDSKLKLQHKGTEDSKWFIGVDTVDLDDLTADEAEGVWYRSCRCGDIRGFLIREEDLEAAADEGEISIGCQGCSIWLRVLFGVVEDNAELDGQEDSEDTAIPAKIPNPSTSLLGQCSRA